MEWENQIKGFTAFLKLEKSLSENSIEAYRRDVNKLREFLEIRYPGMGPKSVNLDQLTEFLAWIHELGLSSRSQARLVSGIKAFYKYMLLDDSIDTDPTSLLEIPRIGRKLPEVLSVGRLATGLRAVARDAAGTSYDVSAEVAWSSSDPRVLGVEPPGIARVRGPGVAEVQASLGTLRATAPLRVVADPVVSPVRLAVAGRRRMLVSFRTDVRVPEPILLVRRRGGHGWRCVDEGARVLVHGLEPDTSYELRQLAKSELGLMTVRAAGELRTAP